MKSDQHRWWGKIRQLLLCLPPALAELCLLDTSSLRISTSFSVTITGLTCILHTDSEPKCDRSVTKHSGQLQTRCKPSSRTNLNENLPVMALRSLRQIRIPGCSAHVWHANRMAPSFNESGILCTPDHPLRPKLLEDLATAPVDILHWEVVTSASIKTLQKNILRSKLQERWNHAFRTALLRHGYATDGHNLVTPRLEPGLVGRVLVLITHGQGFNATNEELHQQCCAVVTALKERQRGMNRR